MIHQKNIRSFVAGFMLLMFAFSITPQRTLHDIFKCHKGEINQTAADGRIKISKGIFHCSCQQADLQVVFIATLPFFVNAPLQYIASRHTINTDVVYIQAILAKTQRGPPAQG